jgi:hypothetical protein
MKWGNTKKLPFGGRSGCLSLLTWAPILTTWKKNKTLLSVLFLLSIGEFVRSIRKRDIPHCFLSHLVLLMTWDIPCYVLERWDIPPGFVDDVGHPTWFCWWRGTSHTTFGKGGTSHLVLLTMWDIPHCVLERWDIPPGFVEDVGHPTLVSENVGCPAWFCWRRGTSHLGFWECGMSRLVLLKTWDIPPRFIEHMGHPTWVLLSLRQYNRRSLLALTAFSGRVYLGSSTIHLDQSLQQLCMRLRIKAKKGAPIWMVYT